MSEFSLYVGIDWGSESHQVCALDATQTVRMQKAVQHSGKDLAALVQELLALVDGNVKRVAVGIETPRGAVVETLLEHGISVFAVNPKQLDRFRDRHTVGGAKDDRRDAFVLADALRTDQHKFRQVRLGDPLVVQLRELSRMHDDLKAECNALGNRLRDQLQRYYPQILELGSVYDTRWLWDLLEIAPTPERGKAVRIGQLRTLLKRHRIRSVKAETVRDVLAAQPLHVAPGVREACQAQLRFLLPRLRLVVSQKVETEREMAKLVEKLSEPLEGKSEHRDARLIRSLVGAGTVVCATMLAEASEPLERRDYTTLRALCGVAPITKQSGKSKPLICRRTACNWRLRAAVHYWAGNAVIRDPHWKARYAQARAKGHSHARALRGIGDRLLAVLISMLKNNTPYEPNHRRAVHGLGSPSLQLA